MPLARLAPEWRTFTDPRTGATVTQWTSHPAMHHHCYFTNPTLSPDGRLGLFISYRSGYPNLWAIDLVGGELRQITDRVDINPFSAAPSAGRPVVYFSARSDVWAVELDGGDEHRLAHFPGARMGNCSLNRAGTLLAIGLRYADHGELALLDLRDGSSRILTRAAEVGHVQFSPRDDRLLLYSGTARRRLWLHDRRAGRDLCLYEQPPDEWIVHESWRHGSVDEIIFPCWPRELRAIRPDGSGQRVIAAVNAWHPCSSPDGRTIIADTNHPDRGLVLIDADSGSFRTLVHPGATQRGSQWVHSLPAVGAGIDTSILRSERPEQDPAPTPHDPPGVYGPQWTHPHPTFSGDGRRVIFTSDRDGWSHVYHVMLPA